MKENNMCIDFKEETINYINSLINEGSIKSSEIEGLYIYRPHTYIDEFEPENEDDWSKVPHHNARYIQKGGEIDWDRMLKELHLDNWVYDSGYGQEEFMGYITFKDSGTWIMRREYDGSEWWATFSKPNIDHTIEQIKKDDEYLREFMKKKG